MSTEQRASDSTILDYARSVPNHPIHCPICNRKVPMLVLAKGTVTLEPARCTKCLVLHGTKSVNTERLQHRTNISE